MAPNRSLGLARNGSLPILASYASDGVGPNPDRQYQRQPRAGATWVITASKTCAL